MSGSQLTPVSNSGGPTGLRKKSARNANKVDDVEFPTNYVFLVYFDCDNKISVLKPGHGSWPNHLTNSMKLSLKWEDLPFKSDKKPKEFINGLVITSGPSEILERVAVLMTLKLKKGMAPTDMNLTQEFEDARQEIETEKQREKENNDPRKNVGSQKSSSGSLRKCSKSFPAMPIESCPSDSEGTDSDHEADEPTFPVASTDKVQKDIESVVSKAEVVCFCFFSR